MREVHHFPSEARKALDTAQTSSESSRIERIDSTSSSTEGAAVTSSTRHRWLINSCTSSCRRSSDSLVSFVDRGSGGSPCEKPTADSC